MSEEVMDDHEFLSALEQLHATEDSDVAELLKMMNENRIISWEEAEQILGDTQTVVKTRDDGVYRVGHNQQSFISSLPEQTRPSEPDNDTDIERCVQQLNDNDPNLKKINLNNMKRTPIPSIKRLIEAVAYNTVLEELSLANLGLYDTNCEMLPAVLELNTTLKKLNLETNYLSGDFFAKLFKAACINQTLEEVKAVNQGVSFATTAEKEIIDSILENRGLTKISLNLRLPEGRHKIENATLRNGEIKRVLRREAAAKAKKEAEEAAKKPAPKPETKPVKFVSKCKLSIAIRGADWYRNPRRSRYSSSSWCCCARNVAPPAKKPVVAPAPVKPAPPAAKPVPKPATAPKPEPKPEPVKPKEPEPKPEPKPVPKPWAPKAVPAKPEPTPEPKPVRKPWAPKAASPPKEETKPIVNKPIFPKKTMEPLALPERKTLPVTARSSSSRTSFLKETLEAKSKEHEKKPMRKVIRKIKKPIETPNESTDTEKKSIDVKETNGKETNGNAKKVEDTNGTDKNEEVKPIESKVIEKPTEENGQEKIEEVKPKTKIVKKIIRRPKKKEGEKKEEEEKKEDEPRRTFGDDYLTTRPRRRSSAIKAF
ncbi:tmd-2 [Pristionchus pacificus]|uniref:Tmd-2 n=1 Tax=Pristionchus pacificus TaxID=54126 RepID=A0A2A6CA99_PRIPA|nr:tmd-2 [Pristionchus pacificus]|eukprot:PDM75020.1 tmd-2 [Pristionchus pacificus]